jgi:hypothetical protein
MLPKHPAFHHNLTGDEAERRLKVCDGHCYLIRFSKAQDCYMLSVYRKERSMPLVKEHYGINITDNDKIMIEGNEKEFDSLEALLCYYQDNPIDTALSSIGRRYTENEYINRKTCTVQ